ncbi:hypothetical protein [Natrinema sp. H-ect4]|uniref:hypothetical protein n=1 Tax=Natrinema sp. H-ect4 TaxID=3242699 RepID=UPI0035A965DD
MIQNSGGGTAVDVFAEIAVENEIRTWACPVMSSGESATLPLLKSQKPNKTYSYTEEVFDRINHSTKMKVTLSCENTLHEKEKFVKEFSIKERIEKLQDTEDATTRSELDSIDDSLINIDRNLGRIKSELKR